jgi:1,4-dihydroxy-2-naphthoate octaprenyltransferase
VLAAAVAGGIYLTVATGWVVVAIGAASIAAALAYTAGPTYGYRGLGELFVFVFFGLAATVGSRYVHDGTAPAAAWLLAIPIGLLVTAILVANNVRDIDTDARTGKRTLAVRLGRGRTRLLFAGLVWGAFLLIAVFAALGWTPRLTAIALLAAPGALRPVQAVATHVSGPPLITALKATARLHAVVGALAGLGAAF